MAFSSLVFLMRVKILTYRVRCGSPLETIMAVWRASNKKKRQTVITICSELSHPTRSLSIIVCRGQEGPKGRKGTLGPDFQTDT